MPMKTVTYASLLTALTLTACSIFHRPIIVSEYDRIPYTKNQNVCKMLTDTVMVYALFVDVDIYHPWTEFDIASTMDSLNRASKWLEVQAKKRDKHLHIERQLHKQGTKLSIYERPAKVSLSLNGITNKGGNARKKLTPWADGISKYAARGLKYKPSSAIHERLKIIDLQTLNLALRDHFKRENVAILFFVNGYYENHPSYSFHTDAAISSKVEYSIITTKNPAVIAHEILHLFGAVDLYPHPAYSNFNFDELKEVYPNELMLVQHKKLEKLDISPITSYFVGWQDTLSKSDTRLLLHKKNLIDY